MEIETITPAKAKQYLATRANNRSLSEARVLEYGLAMEAGRWVLNGETIKFDEKGHLFDGQHRLEACVLAEKSFQSYVVRNVRDERAMSTVDTGKARSHTDVWTIAGHTSAALCSSIALMVMLYEQNRLGWSGYIGRRLPRSSPLAARAKRMPTRSGQASKEELLGYGESHIEELARSAQFVIACPVKKVMSPQACGSLYYFAARKDPVAAAQFLNDVGSGIGLQEADPALALREHIRARTKMGVKLNQPYVFGMLVKAWNARRAGSKIKVLRVGPDEEFPKVK